MGARAGRRKRWARAAGRLERPRRRTPRSPSLLRSNPLRSNYSRLGFADALRRDPHFGVRDDEMCDRRRASGTKGLRARFERRAGGRDIVDEKHSPALERALILHDEGAFDVGAPEVAIEQRLLGGVTRADECAGRELAPEMFSDWSCE